MYGFTPSSPKGQPVLGGDASIYSPPSWAWDHVLRWSNLRNLWSQNPKYSTWLKFMANLGKYSIHGAYGNQKTHTLRIFNSLWMAPCSWRSACDLSPTSEQSSLWRLPAWTQETGDIFCKKNTIDMWDVYVNIYIYKHTPFQPSNNCTCFFWWGWRETKITDKYDNEW